MPICKNADERYKVYDRLFRDTNRPNGYCREEIDMELEQNITPQQFNRDINNMIALFFNNDDEAISRKKVGKKTYYTYPDKTRGINVNSRTYEAVTKLSQMEGLGIDELIDDICESAGVHKDSSPIISYSTPNRLEGLEWLLPLYSAIVDKRVIDIVFLRSFEDFETYTIHPYHLRRYNGRWFLFGWNPTANHIYNIALDRVNDIKDRQDIMYEDSESHGIHFGGDNDFYKDVVGVTRYENVPVKTIYIRFSEKSFNYVRTKPLHPSQKNSGNNTVSITVSPNYELDSLILSYGNNAEVIGPPEYREHIREIVKSLSDKYKE